MPLLVFQRSQALSSGLIGIGSATVERLPLSLPIPITSLRNRLNSVEMVLFAGSEAIVLATLLSWLLLGSAASMFLLSALAQMLN